MTYKIEGLLVLLLTPPSMTLFEFGVSNDGHFNIDDHIIVSWSQFLQISSMDDRNFHNHYFWLKENIEEVKFRPNYYGSVLRAIGPFTSRNFNPYNEPLSLKFQHKLYKLDLCSIETSTGHSLNLYSKLILKI